MSRHRVGTPNHYMGIQNSNKCKTIKNGDNFHLKAFFIRRRVLRFLYHLFVTIIWFFFVGSRGRSNLTIYSLIPLELFKIRWKLNQTYRKHFEFRYKKKSLSRFSQKYGFSSQKNSQQQTAVLMSS